MLRKYPRIFRSFEVVSGDDSDSFEMRYQDENIWLTQKMMAALYDISVSAVNQQLKRIYDDEELPRTATIKKYLIVQTEGVREVAREVEHYNLRAIINNNLEDFYTGTVVSTVPVFC